jgi:DNA-directed RNA polymerase subunit RPC12/RpoP
VTTEPKSTPAPFQPNTKKWLARFNAIEILGVLVGLAICSLGSFWPAIGSAMVLAAIYSAYFIPPKINRGLYIGKCPHCGDDMSATHYQSVVDCPNCGKDVLVKDSRFVALPASAGHKAA